MSNKNKSLEKYIVTIMQKHYVGDNAFVYNTINTMIGTIDPTTKIFTSDCGREYTSMVDQSLMYSEIPYAYYNHIPLTRLNETIKENLPQKKAIAKYEELCNDILYYVVNNKGKTFLIAFNKEELKNTCLQSTEPINSKGQEQYSDEEIIAPSEMDDSLVDLVSDIIAGNYTLAELKDLRENLIQESEHLESVVDTLDLQIEATEKKESSVKLKEESEEQEEVVEEKITMPINVNDLYNKVTKTLIAQDEPARRLIVEIARMSMSKENKNGILLTGSTGVGKTKVMSLIAKYINRPFLTIDSTQLTVPGIVGKSIEQCLWDLYLKCDRDLEKAENAIIFFDEIDKKGSSSKSDVSGKGVLNVLLKFLDGTTYRACENPQTVTKDSSIMMDTSSMIVVAGGAFTDVYKNLQEKNALGFTTSTTKIEEKKEPTLEDFVNKAMMPDEFMGRVPIVIHLNDWTPATMKQYLLESDESPLKRETHCFDCLGVKLKVTEDYLNTITKKAYDKKTGARGLSGLITDTTWRPFDEVSSNIGKYEEVELGEETIENNKVYKLIKKSDKKETISN